jgi:amino acid transporter/mannitol/fructose-specific phosphotransferase system IIA component (Ntr-type)
MKLKKSLSTIEVFSFGAGSMISSGLFVLPSLAYSEASGGMIIAYFLAGLLMLPALFSQLELATAIPKSGGTYFFLERILGTPVGMLAGFANWFSISLKSAFALVGIGIFATILSPNLTPALLTVISVAACCVFTLLNILSVESSSRTQVFLVVFLISVLILFVLLGYRAADRELFAQSWELSVSSILTTTGMVFISYGGITKIASLAEEAKDPKRTLVKGTLLAFFLVQLLYLIIVALLPALLPAADLSSSLTPITDASQRMVSSGVFSGVLLVLTLLAGIMAFITTANAGIMAASRAPMAMSRDKLLPEVFARLSKKRKTPIVSILLTSAFMITVITVLEVEELAKVASVFMLLLFALINLALIVIRFSRITNYRPSFKSPLFPVLQIIGVGCYITLIVTIGTLPLLFSGGFIVLSLLIYLIYARKRVERKSALISMIERLAKPDLAQANMNLEDELLDILIEREEIEEDRFDSLIRQAPVIDLDHTVTRDELFSSIGELVGERWNIDSDHVKEKLVIREEEASTLIYPGVAVPHAIPHVILEGKHRFDIILVRNRFGIRWNEKGDIVYTAFVLVGTKDEREFHLRALMWIAQILQDPAFHKEWHKAKGPAELRTVLLLTKRRRG